MRKCNWRRKKINNKPDNNSRAETLVISGSARLPKELSGEGNTGRLWVELEIIADTSEIVDFSCSRVSRLGEKMLREALLGHEIEEGIKNAVNEVEKRFFSIIKRATIAALEDACMAYRRTQKNMV
ncbi:MAG: DUF3870 domain-containing protein [Candidatus Omnitrophota bacterium]|nr:MAG: DUF3870 domain-containing protein [Candidatus Omnitrophota bacterium]